MRFRIVNVEKLPLGTRVLRTGAKGDDVKSLQDLLVKDGFYFGKSDGVFGPLTEEAVRLLQRTFKLRIDGIAGNESIAVLKNPSRKTGRIIYTVKAGDNLHAISRKYKVNSSAWQGISGYGNPQSHIYRGMRLLLHEKALFWWDEPPAKNILEHIPQTQSPIGKSKKDFRDQIRATGTIRQGWTIEKSGELICRNDPSQLSGQVYWTIDAESEVWTKVFSSQNFKSKLELQLLKLKSFKIGFDLRNTPLSTIFYWPKFFKHFYDHLRLKDHFFIVLPIYLNCYQPSKQDRSFPKTLFWTNTVRISQFVNFLLFEPLLQMDTLPAYRNSVAELANKLQLLEKYKLNYKSLLTISVDCWDWNLDSNCYQRFPYKKAKMIRAMNPYSTVYSPESNITSVNYRSRHQTHCLIYQTAGDLEKLLSQINQANLLGIAFRNFSVLGDEGINLIQNSFTVLPEAKLSSTAYNLTQCPPDRSIR